VLSVDFQGLRIPRSTLYRRVTEHPDYAAIAVARRASRQPRRRTRFVARRLHQRWQCDAKGPFEVHLTSKLVIRVHVITILEDASRAVLAATVVDSPDLGEAVRLFRKAAGRWGLPEQYYADRGAIFDAQAFRAGLAILGVHRIWTKPRNAPAHGKIEAYHRVLALWFVERLKVQQVVDREHLGQLLDGMIAMLYQPHCHRSLKKPPKEVLADTISERQVPRTQLYEAFLDEKTKKTNKATGEVDLQGRTWLVPDALRGRDCLFLLDPAAEWEPVVAEPGPERRLPLRRAQTTMEQATKEPERWGDGPLQKLSDAWAGKVRPVAEPGFGMPELYRLLAAVVGRHVPRSQDEAARLQSFYREHGPLPQKATEKAFESIGREHKPGHAIAIYLDALRVRIGRCKERKDELLPFLRHRFASEAERVPEDAHEGLFERTRAAPGVIDKVVRHALCARSGILYRDDIDASLDLFA
jgi:transposase InsO family protein